MTASPFLASAALVAHLLEPFGDVPELGAALPSLSHTPVSEVPVYPSVHSVFNSFTSRFEGMTRFMYLDQIGLVTVGRGNLVDKSPGSPLTSAAPALGLIWRNAAGEPATPSMILAEWQRVKGLQRMNGAGGGAFAKGATLWLDEASLAQLIEGTLTEDETVLRVLIRDYDSIPADGQLATLDMSWAMGPYFAHGYPNWLAAMNASFFATAAAECAISHPVNDSLKARNAANALLFQNAAEVVSRGLRRDVIYYPRDLANEPPSAPPPPVASDGA